jgi:hypothetical protein
MVVRWRFCLHTATESWGNFLDITEFLNSKVAVVLACGRGATAAYTPGQGHIIPYHRVETGLTKPIGNLEISVRGHGFTKVVHIVSPGTRTRLQHREHAGSA